MNADSLQVYQACPILTAQPSPDDIRQTPHKLYGYIPPHQHYSVARWLEDVKSLVGHKPFIFVGGTGFYFHALVHGISDIPQVPLDVRNQAEALFDDVGANAFHENLKRVDPTLAARLNPHDKQRTVRAYSVWLATGISLSHWHTRKSAPLIPADSIRSIVISPAKETLHQRAHQRFLAMIEQGAIDEVQQLIAAYPREDLSPTLAKAIGLRPIADFLQGLISHTAMIEQSLLQTKQYIKRQRTWFRHQPLPNTVIVEDSNIENISPIPIPSR